MLKFSFFTMVTNSQFRIIISPAGRIFHSFSLFYFWCVVLTPDYVWCLTSATIVVHDDVRSCNCLTMHANLEESTKLLESVRREAHGFGSGESGHPYWNVPQKSWPQKLAAGVVLQVWYSCHGCSWCLLLCRKELRQTMKINRINKLN